MRDPSDITTSVIIPTAKETVRTVDSLPDGVDTHVVREGNRAEARNIGARKARGDVLVFCDDDIAFSPAWFRHQVAAVDRGEVRGLRDFDFGLLLTRYLAVRAADFRRVGGFDPELNHMEDTEWCLRAERDGLTLCPLPRDTVKHATHDNEIGRRDRLRSLQAVARRHPDRAPELVRGVIT